jgi:hypothetical protein
MTASEIGDLKQTSTSSTGAPATQTPPADGARLRSYSL